ncbi:hypothetical protein RFI_25356 [Reticulomyxa filosa]|uniref:Uncharacterized protein n=1 Tax=Reticulomyxa filosa TaxID=46433 RepID=X6MG47_RETFI|nr:hypothetical protein RFI_25356 [Reticulomyxa filosa]|eukprot:ETO12020.1 hypothetical protein RFI_25356 [Reticulomyxa filosa]
MHRKTLGLKPPRIEEKIKWFVFFFIFIKKIDYMEFELLSPKQTYVICFSLKNKNIILICDCVLGTIARTYCKVFLFIFYFLFMFEIKWIGKRKYRKKGEYGKKGKKKIKKKKKEEKRRKKGSKRKKKLEMRISAMFKEDVVLDNETTSQVLFVWSVSLTTEKSLLFVGQQEMAGLIIDEWTKADTTATALRKILGC